jgi:hypothetical protein
VKSAVLALLCLPLLACQVFFNGDDDGIADDVFDADVADARPIADARPRPDADPLAPDAGACAPTLQTFTPDPSPHQTDETVTITYSTNPPSSGPHYPHWVRWDGVYAAAPVKRENYVHNLEHGGVVFLFNCPDGCPEVVDQLDTLQDTLPADPLCAAPLRTRTLVTADPLLPAGVQVAATAWGATYTASCFDEDSLRAFYTAHFGHGSEATCANGSVP